MATNTVKVDVDGIFEDFEVMLWVMRIRRNPELVDRLNVTPLARGLLVEAAGVVGRIRDELRDSRDGRE